MSLNIIMRVYITQKKITMCKLFILKLIKKILQVIVIVKIKFQTIFQVFKKIIVKIFCMFI